MAKQVRDYTSDDLSRIPERCEYCGAPIAIGEERGEIEGGVETRWLSWCCTAYEEGEHDLHSFGPVLIGAC